MNGFSTGSAFRYGCRTGSAFRYGCRTGSAFESAFTKSLQLQYTIKSHNEIKMNGSIYVIEYKRI